MDVRLCELPLCARPLIRPASRRAPCKSSQAGGRQARARAHSALAPGDNELKAGRRPARRCPLGAGQAKPRWCEASPWRPLDVLLRKPNWVEFTERHKDSLIRRRFLHVRRDKERERARAMEGVIFFSLLCKLSPLPASLVPTSSEAPTLSRPLLVGPSGRFNIGSRWPNNLLVAGRVSLRPRRTRTHADSC